MVQSRKAQQVRSWYVPPTEEELRVVTHVAEDAYSSCRWRIPDDFMEKSHFLRVLDSLDGTSSPGLPYCRSYSTINAYFGSDDKMFWSAQRKEELWARMLNAIMTLEVMIMAVFVKSEVHKPAKVLAKRWRLIFTAPLHFLVLGQMLFKDLHDREVSQTYRHPSMYGMRVFRGGWMAFKASQKAMGFSESYDRKAWDFQTPRWVFEASLELRKRLCENMNARWEALATWYYEVAYYKTDILLSNGMMFSQEVEAMMKSGLNMTISDNSRAQYLEHSLARLRWCRSKGLPFTVPPLMAVGDDTLQAPEPRGYLTELQKAGCQIKQGHSSLEEPEFVGMYFPDSGPRPAYVVKHMATIVYQKDELLPETLDSYLTLYSKTSLFQFWREVAYSLGHVPKSLAYYSEIVDCPDV